MCAIRYKIQEFYVVRKEAPTLRRLLVALKKDINFVGGRESLHLILHKLGYNYKKCKNQRKILIERHDIVAWRAKYLHEIKLIRESGMPIVYFTESYIPTTLNHSNLESDNEAGVSKAVATNKRYIIVHCGGKNGLVPNTLSIYNDNDREKRLDFYDPMNKENFKKWMLEKLIPNLNKPTCIVMDNAGHHSSQINKPPNSMNGKQEIADWLTLKNISYPAYATKDMMLALVKRHKPEPIYEIDQLVQEHGHKILRLPPYHSDLNPLEMIWDIVKEKVAVSNISVDNALFLKLVEDSFEEIPAETWKKYCEHVNKKEENYRSRGAVIDTEIEQIIINVGGSESDTSNQESDYESDMSSS
ncbi:hypothetical protein O3G_MSEX009708 [Manduca sexta]|nr:hypothetical protein O3G_MSEX009708 [Manduca sexta]